MNNPTPPLDFATVTNNGRDVPQPRRQWRTKRKDGLILTEDEDSFVSDGWMYFKSGNLYENIEWLTLHTPAPSEQRPTEHVPAPVEPGEVEKLMEELIRKYTERIVKTSLQSKHSNVDMYLRYFRTELRALLTREPAGPENPWREWREFSDAHIAKFHAAEPRERVPQEFAQKVRGRFDLATLLDYLQKLDMRIVSAVQPERTPDTFTAPPGKAYVMVKRDVADIKDATAVYGQAGIVAAFWSVEEAAYFCEIANERVQSEREAETGFERAARQQFWEDWSYIIRALDGHGNPKEAISRMRTMKEEVVEAFVRPDASRPVEPPKLSARLEIEAGDTRITTGYAGQRVTLINDRDNE